MHRLGLRANFLRPKMHFDGRRCLLYDLHPKMSFSLQNFRFSGATVAVLLCALFSGSLQAQQSRGRAIHFSDPKADTASTNVNQMGVRNSGLKNLEDDLFRPLQSFSPKSSLDGVAAPLPPPHVTRPVVPSQRARELMDRRRNWVFTQPEDSIPGLTAEEMFNLREYDEDGQEKKKLSAVEEYYERLYRERNSALDAGRERFDARDDRWDEDVAETRPPVPESESERNLRQLLYSSPAANNLFPSSDTPAFVDLFRNRDANVIDDGTRAQKARLEEFKQMMDFQSPSLPSPFAPTPFTGSLDSFHSPRPPISPQPRPFDSPIGSSGSFGSPGTLGSINSSLSPATMPDLSTRSFQQHLTPPPPEPVRVAPTMPSFTAPRRQF